MRDLFLMFGGQRAGKYTVHRAAHLSFDNFRGMTHRDGQPAWNHSHRVACNFRNDPVLMAIAYLHDVLEDTSVTEEQLRQLFTSRIVDAVVALTRLKGESWNAYMRKVEANPDAIRVKIADIEDNLARMDEKMASGSRGGAMYYEAHERLTGLLVA